jgi:broad specificity phosphatase PhoE
MRTVELRRNSQWTKATASLSEAGEKAAVAARPHLGGPYHAYYSSPSKRCRHTLRALGFATWRAEKEFGRFPKWFDRFQHGLVQEGPAPHPFLEGYLAHPEARARLLRRGAAVLDQVRKVSTRLPEDGRALILSHQLTIELVAMLARGDENPAAIGRELEPLEGVAIDFDDQGKVLGVRELRLPPEVISLLDN